MTVIARKVASSPARGPVETWTVIVNLIAPTRGQAREELEKVSGIAACVIGSEAPKNDPIVIWGHGPRVRIYCLFGEDSVTGDGINEEPLPACPTQDTWAMSLPSPPEDLPWIKEELLRLSTHVTARSTGEPVETDGIVEADSQQARSEIDLESFLKP